MREKPSSCELLRLGDAASDLIGATDSSATSTHSHGHRPVGSGDQPPAKLFR